MPPLAPVVPAPLIIGPDPDSAADVWTLLQNQFRKESWLNKLTIKKKLYNLRLTGNNVSGHIKEMTELFQSLTLLGCEVEDEEKCVYCCLVYLNNMTFWLQH